MCSSICVLGIDPAKVCTHTLCPPPLTIPSPKASLGTCTRRSATLPLILGFLAAAVERASEARSGCAGEAKPRAPCAPRRRGPPARPGGRIRRPASPAQGAVAAPGRSRGGRSRPACASARARCQEQAWAPRSRRTPPESSARAPAYRESAGTYAVPRALAQMDPRALPFPPGPAAAPAPRSPPCAFAGMLGFASRRHLPSSAALGCSERSLTDGPAAPAASLPSSASATGTNW